MSALTQPGKPRAKYSPDQHQLRTWSGRYPARRCRQRSLWSRSSSCSRSKSACRRGSPATMTARERALIDVLAAIWDAADDAGVATRLGHACFADLARALRRIAEQAAVALDEAAICCTLTDTDAA